MRRLSEDQRRQALKTWEEVSLEIRDSYNLTPAPTPESVVLSTEERPAGGLQPGRLDAQVIIINSDIPDSEMLLPYTIMKLCLRSALPSNLLCEECIDDLSFEYARRRIDNEEARKKWDSLWIAYAPPRKLSKVMTYFPSDAYRWLHSVAGDDGLDTYIRELTQRARNQIPVLFDDYMQYFTKRIRRFENPLDDTELKIVNALIEHPEAPSIDIAVQIGISEEWLSKKVAQLEKRMILRQFYRAPFSKIGIRIFHVLIGRTTGDADPFDLLKECPLLYAYRKVVSGDHIALATLCIPDNPESMEYLELGFQLVEKAGFVVDVHRIASSGSSHCFDYYSTKSAQWDIPWELLGIHLERIQSDGLASSIPRIDVPESRVNIQLDELDMRILGCLWRRISSVSKIRTELKVGQQRVVDRLHNLKDNGLMTRSWEAHNIGLSEHALVHSGNRECGQTIAAWALRLPRSVISFSSKKELMLLADLPRGGSFGIASALEAINHDTSVGILSSQIYGSWGFPSSLWDAKFQKWMCPKRDLETWISGLDG